MNHVTLVGRLTADPVIRYSGETPIASYNVAVDRRFKKDNGEPTADFIPVTSFGKAAEFIEKYFFKGKRIGLTGHIQTHTYTKQDGSKGYGWSVISETVEFVDSKKDGAQQQTAQQSAPPADGGWHNSHGDAPFTDQELDELPFV